MEVQNIRINWKPLLEKQKEGFQKIYPEMELDSTFTSLEEQLNLNMIPSRVIIRENMVKGFAYITGLNSDSGRSYGFLCFPEPDLYSNTTLESLLKWMEDLALGSSKKLIIGIIDAPENLDRIMTESGYEIFRRKRMVCDLSSAHGGKSSEVKSPEVRIEPLTGIDIPQYAESQAVAYSGTPDETFMLPDDAKGRIRMVEEMFKGNYGEIMLEPSGLILNGKKVEGSVIVSQGRLRRDGTRVPLLLDVFVLPDLRGKGIGAALLKYALDKLRESSCKKVELWVSEGNHAEHLYSRMGFTVEGQPDIAYIRNLRQ